MKIGPPRRNADLRVGLSLFFAVFASFVNCARAQDQGPSSPIVINAKSAASPSQALSFSPGGQSPDGKTLSANNRYLTRDGKPWFPVMGEFHYSRYPETQWEKEILKMKAGGIEVVSTYVFWIFHEEIEGQFDWTGQRDLRHFIELCARHDLYVWVRVGPWDHGEVRNGGLPDWLIAETTVRENNPAYLGYVRRFFIEIGKQLDGLFWKDGGEDYRDSARKRVQCPRAGKRRRPHPTALSDCPGGRSGRSFLYRDGMGQCRHPIPRRTASIRRLCRWLLVAQRDGSAAQSKLFLYPHSLRGKCSR